MTTRRKFQRAKGGLRCRNCLTRRAVHSHHVVYEAELRHRGWPLYDYANLMALCLECHFAHHGAVRRIPLALLTDENIDYAFRVLGAYAFDYLGQRYAGEDPRLADGLRRSEGAA